MPIIGQSCRLISCGQHADHVRRHGVIQFLNIWRRLRHRVGDKLLWGDEVEYVVVSFDHANRNARLSLRQSEILRELHDEEVKAAGQLGERGYARSIPLESRC